jgi:twitching motility protein PilI
MAGSQVLDMLREIEADTFRNAAPLPSKRDARPQWQGIGFQLGGVRLVAPLGEVAEILKVPRVTALPRVKPWVLGVANVRGRLIPVIDLHRFLNMTATVARLQWRVLIVEDGDLIAGLLVEQSLGMLHFTEDSFDAGVPDTLEALARYVKGSYRQGGRQFCVASMKSLIRDDRFLEVQE